MKRVLNLIVKWLLVSTVNSVINVNYDLDNITSEYSNCDGSSKLCNLRSAWLYCSVLAPNSCTIQLPSKTLYFNTTNGHLRLDNNRNITLQGNENTIIEAIQPVDDYFIKFANITAALFVSQLSFYNFGGSRLDGSVIQIIGNCSLLITDASFINNKGNKGGVLYFE